MKFIIEYLRAGKVVEMAELDGSAEQVSRLVTANLERREDANVARIVDANGKLVEFIDPNAHRC